MDKNRKAWLIVIVCIAVLISGLAFVPWFTLAKESRFDWQTYASLYEPLKNFFLPLIAR